VRIECGLWLMLQPDEMGASSVIGIRTVKPAGLTPFRRTFESRLRTGLPARMVLLRLFKIRGWCPESCGICLTQPPEGVLRCLPRPIASILGRLWPSNLVLQA
jgi:hypothetical protein